MDPLYIQIAAITAVALLLVTAAFQVLLAAGLPLGEAAWGGYHRVLPPKLRVASGVAVVVWLTVAVVLLEHGNVLALGVDTSVTRIALWVLTPLLALGVLMNAVSRSKKERLWTPVVAALFASCLFLAVFG